MNPQFCGSLSCCIMDCLPLPAEGYVSFLCAFLSPLEAMYFEG